MKEIPVTGGFVALVDDEDEILVKEYSWQGKVKSHTVYVRARVRGERRRFVYMHRLILNTPKDIEVDHIDGNGLNCQRYNLRLATHSQNHCNAVKRQTQKGSPMSSRYKGVGWCEDMQRWRARIRLDRKQRHLGYFSSEEAAASAYDRAAIALHGEFARPNFLGYFTRSLPAQKSFP